MATRDRDEEQPQTFAWPLIGALYASVVVIVVIAILESNLGRRLEHELAAPARTLIAAPVVATAVIVFLASMVALVAPRYRRSAMKVAEIAAWLIPAWLMIGALVLGAVDYALHHGG